MTDSQPLRPAGCSLLHPPVYVHAPSQVLSAAALPPHMRSAPASTSAAFVLALIMKAPDAKANTFIQSEP